MVRTYPDMKITGRITNYGKTVGYVIVDTSGISKNLRREKIIELARAYKFINASAYIRDGSWQLKGENGTNLLELPTYKLKNAARAAN